LDAPYTAGRPNSGGNQLKHKFYATCSAVVSKVNSQRSVELRLLNCPGWVPVGNVTIPVNRPVPEVGWVVEIRYLYAFKESNALYQPVYRGRRSDIEQHECTLSQLKSKPATATVSPRAKTIAPTSKRRSNRWTASGLTCGTSWATWAMPSPH